MPDRARSTGHLGTLGEAPGAGSNGVVSKERKAEPLQAGYATKCSVRAAVQDASFQEEGAETSWHIHPSAVYPALKVPRDLRSGQSAAVQLRLLNPAGEPAGPAGVKVDVTRKWWEPIYAGRGERTYVSSYRERSAVETRCRFPKMTSEVRCPLNRIKEGVYEVRAVARSGGNMAITLGRFYVAGSSPRLRMPPPKRLEIHTPKQPQSPGDVVEVVIRAPWKDAHGLLLVSRGGLRERIPFQLDGDEARIPLTVDDTWVPRVHLDAQVWQPSGGTRRAALHQKSARIDVGNEHRALEVVLDLQATALPQQSVPVTVQARDHTGRGVDGRVTIWAVDDAVLSLTNYAVRDILDAITTTRHSEILADNMYSLLLVPWVPPAADPLLSTLEFGGTGFGALGTGYGAGGGGGGAALAVARSRFETTPLFLADAAIVGGTARTEISLPDNLTTFRVMAIATTHLEGRRAPGRAGSDDTTVTVSKPVIVRAAMPRQLRPGDEFTVAAIVSAPNSPAGTPVTVIAQMTGEAGQTSPIGLRSERRSAPLGDNHQARIEFKASAATAGTVQVTLTALVGKESDAIEVPLEVRTEPTAVEHVAFYGTLDSDEPVALPVRTPKTAIGKVRVGIDANVTVLSGLEDAARELVHYPYGCLEQTSSRLVPLVALGNLGEIGFEVGDIGDINQFVTEGISRILSMQTPSGGFAYWPGGAHPNAYASAYAVWVLTMAADAKHHVPEEALENALRWLEETTKHPDEDWPAPLVYLHDIRRAIAVHALAASGRADPDAITRLYQRRADLPLFATLFVAMAMHSTDRADPRIGDIIAELSAALTQSQSEAHVVETIRWNLDEVFYSSTRTDAIALLALLTIAPDHPAVAKMARGLLGKRTNGSWRNTQENAYAVMALAAYAKQFERETPNLRVRAWVGDERILDAELVGRRPGPARGHRNFTADEDAEPISVVLQRTGAGRLYYRLGMEYTLPTSAQTQLARGIELKTALRTESGVLPESPEIPAGTLLAMDISVKARTRIRHVAINLPIPAGLEPVNLSLGGAKVLPLSGQRSSSVSHEELHPDRALVFIDDLLPGTHRHTVYLRATTPGTYDMPAGRAEAMYAPETFGRTPGRRIAVR
jgi:uncharacterized protein YfaS (alpha-2-macroglobulin family)